MDHAVDIAIQADEQTELGRVLDFALDDAAHRVLFCKGVPGVRLCLLEAQRDAALFGIDFQNDDIDFLAGRNDLAGMDVLLGPRHFRNVHQTFDARLELDERPIFGDVGDGTRKLRTDRILDAGAFPRIAFELLHAQRDALRILVDTDDLHLDGFADADRFARVVDALVADVGDVQQAVDAAQVNERTIIGDVLDDAVDDLAFGQRLDETGALFGTGFFQNGATRHDDVAATTVHLENLEGLRNVHQRGDIAHGADIDLAAGQERDGAVEIDGEAALDAAEDHAFDALAFAEFIFQLVPCGFAACAVARQHRFAIGILDPVDIDFDFVADLQAMVLTGGGELAQRHAAFRLQTDVDDGLVVFDCSDRALDDAAFESAVNGSGAAQRFVEKCRKIIAAGKCRRGHKSNVP